MKLILQAIKSLFRKQSIELNKAIANISASAQLTPADKAEIANLVLDLLPTWEGGSF